MGPAGAALDPWAELARRHRRPMYWAVWALLYAFCLNVDLRPLPRTPADWAMGLEQSAVGLWCIIWLSPVPWQWRTRPTGRGLLRGFLQAVPAMELTVLFFYGVYCALSKLLGSTLLQSMDLKGLLLLNLGFSGPASVVVGGLIANHEWNQAERAAAREGLQQAQARLLQSQLHPHVLFNALNGLAELARRDPARAQASAEALTELLGRLLQASACDALPLEEERRLVERYLAIEAMRLGDRLRVAWDWDPGLGSLSVPPLLLQPLVENAVKHGIAPRKEGGELRISGRRRGPWVELEVRNPGSALPAPPEPHRPGEAIGLRNLAHRLRLAFGEDQELGLEAEGDWTVARIRLKPRPA